MKKEFARNLRILMDRDAVSSARLARELKVGGSTVTSWTKGVSMPGDAHIDQMIEAFKWDISELMGFPKVDSRTAGLRTAIEFLCEAGGFEPPKLQSKKA